MDPLESEIRKIAKEEVDKTEVTVDFPDVQKVEVQNWPEQKEPVVNVNVPDVVVPPIPAPQVTVETKEVTVEQADLTELAEMMQKQAELLNRIAEKETPSFDYKEFERIAKENKSTYRGGAMGPSKINLMNDRGKVIDPQAIKATDSPSIDAFGRWRVSNPETIFDSKQLYDAQPLFWDDQEESGGSTTSTHATATASTTIGVGATTAGKRTRQTFMRFNYQPGKSQLIFMTGVLDKSGGGTGITRGFGYYDDDNGLYLEDKEGTINFVRRTKTSGLVVNNRVAQSSWNLDTMDGTGASGITLDFSKTQILIIDFEWLGVGRARMGFVVDGMIVYAHEFNNANNLSVVYMSTPNLPLRYQIENDGNGAASTLEHICSSVISEGGLQDTGILRYSSSANTQVDAAVVGTLYAVKGIRLKSTHLSATVKLVTAAVALQSSGDDLEWQLVFNPTYSSTPTWGNETNSAVQSFTGAGETVTGGTFITGGYLSSGTGLNASGDITIQIENALRLGSLIDGTQQSIALCVKPLSNVNTLVEGSLTWRELL